MLSLLFRLLGLSLLLRLLRRAPRVVRLDEVSHEPRALFRDVIDAGVAPARAFFDAPAVAALPLARRVEVANALALEASRVCPPVDPRRDSVFVAHLDGATFEAYEARLDRVGGEVRRVLRRGAAPWAPLSPETALDLECLLRADRFGDLPAAVEDERPEDVWWDVWWLARHARGRLHVIRRRRPRGTDGALLVAVMALLRGAVRQGR